MAVPWRGVITVAGAFLVHLTLGTLNSDGNMVPYMISYVHSRLDPSIVMSYTAYIGTLHGASYSILTIPSGYLATRIGYRLTAFISSIIFSGGVALAYFAIKVSFVFLLLTFAFLSGLGGSIGYGTAIACGMKWFPNNHGLAGGIVQAGFGLGAFAFNPLQSLLSNPSNVSPTTDGYFVDPGMLDRVPIVLLQLAAVYFIIQIIGCILISQPPEIEQQVDSSMANLTPLQVLHTKEFYILWLIMFCNTCAMEFCNSMYKAYGQTFIFDDHYLAYVGSLMSVLSALGRCLWGFLLDKYTYVPCMRAVTTGITVLMFTMPATKYIGGKPFYTICNSGVSFFIAGTYALTPAISATVFGTQHMAANYGLLFTSLMAAGLSVAGLSTFLEQIGYMGVFYILGCINVIGIVLTFMFEHVTKTKQLIKSKHLNMDVNNSIQNLDKVAVTSEVNDWTSSENAAKMYERRIAGS